MMTETSTVTIDILIKGLALFAAVVTAYVHVKNLRINLRNSLKTDLEILKLLDVSHPNYDSIKNGIDAELQRYADGFLKKPLPWLKVTVGAIMCAGFSYWTYRLASPNFSWWALLTGLFAFAGLSDLLESFNGGSKPNLKKPKEDKRRSSARKSSIFRY